MQVESDLTAQLTRIRNTNTHEKNRVNQVFSNETQVAARFDIFDRSVDQANYATNTHQSIGIFFSHFLNEIRMKKMISFNNIYRTCLCAALINTANTCLDNPNGNWMWWDSGGGGVERNVAFHIINCTNMTTIMKKRKEMDIKLYYFYLYYLFSEPSER